MAYKKMPWEEFGTNALLLLKDFMAKRYNALTGINAILEDADCPWSNYTKASITAAV